MKPRNREINIFNLSMLDVIAGALGAFLILFLVLAPYYEKTSTRPGSGEVPADAEASRRQIGLSYVAGWERRHADVDLWVQVNGVDWRGPQGKSLFGRIRPVFESPDETGGREDTTWWESYRRVDSVDGIYLFAYGAASPASPAPVSTAPVSEGLPVSAIVPVSAVDAGAASSSPQAAILSRYARKSRRDSGVVKGSGAPMPTSSSAR